MKSLMSLAVFMLLNSTNTEGKFIQKKIKELAQVKQNTKGIDEEVHEEF